MGNGKALEFFQNFVDTQIMRALLQYFYFNKK